jgi:hypothetical protein
MKLFLTIVVFFLSLFIFSCKNDPKSLAFEEETPEFAIKQWQSLVDSSQYDAAKKFSTPRTILWLDKNKSIMGSGDTLTYQMSFTQIACKITGDSAICLCKYTMNGDSTNYDDTYNLKKIDNKWLIDLASDEVDMFQ